MSQGSCCCGLPAHKDTLQGPLISPLPQLSVPFFTFLLPVLEKHQHFACFSWQDMALGTKGDLQESSSAARDGGTIQLPLAGLNKAAECSQCPISLGYIEDAAYMVACLQPFCFACIKDWARSRARCPLCRQPFDLLLHSVQADNDYKEYVVPLSTHHWKDAVRERVWSRCPQRHDNLHSSATDNTPSAGRRGPVGSHEAQRQGTALGLSS